LVARLGLNLTINKIAIIINIASIPNHVYAIDGMIELQLLSHNFAALITKMIIA
jgi:hypothetical protein